MNEEIWCDIKNYEGLYQVSNWGRVKSLYDGRHKKFREKILRPCKNSYGYLRVCFRQNCKSKWYSVHRLVLMTFNPIDGMENLEVNHINEFKDDNRLENLEWCNSSYNNTYNDKHKKVGEKESIPIVQIDLATNKVVNVWKSSMAAEREGGFHRGAINECCRGKRKTHKGYKWQYLHTIFHK